jgi:hypothetical protein
MAATVYMLSGGFSGLTNYMPTMLQGAITKNNTTVQVPYNNMGMFLNTVEAGAQMADTYLHSGTGTKVWYGHSLGAVVGSYWLANYGPTSSIEPSDLSFVFIGNSVSKYGGALGAESGAEWANWFTSAVQIPAGTPYTVTDIKRQYDGWTDYPTGTFSVDAFFNALAGQNSVHPNYQTIDPSPTAAGNVSHTEGNITYIWSQTTPVPSLGTVWNSVASGLDETLRPTIESAYARPVTIPAPTYL